MPVTIYPDVLAGDPTTWQDDSGDGTDGTPLTVAKFQQLTPYFEAVTLTADTTLDDEHVGRIILVDATSGNKTITVPASFTGHFIEIRKVDETSNYITVSASQDGRTKSVLRQRGHGVYLIRLNSEWLSKYFGDKPNPFDSHRTVTSASYTISADGDVGEVVRADCTANSIQIGLPTNANIGWGASGYNRTMVAVVQRVDTVLTNNLSIVPQTGGELEGYTDIRVTGRATLIFYADGSTWRLMWWSGSVRIGLTPPFTDTQTGTQNSWVVPAGASISAWASATYVRWNGGGAMTLNGIQGGVSGLHLYVKNVTAAQTMTINHNSGSAAAGDKILTKSGGAISLTAGLAVHFIYNGTEWEEQ